MAQEDTAVDLDKQRRQHRLALLQGQGVVSEGDLIVLRMHVLMRFSVPEMLHAAMDQAFQQELDKFMDDRESAARKQQLLNGV